jgi:Rod binding domain-containing protein
MKIDAAIPLLKPGQLPERSAEIRQKSTADQFEEFFARHLVQEMTKNSFQMSDNITGMGASRSMYQEFVTDALSTQLAAQRRLGMAEMLEAHWAKQLSPSVNPTEQENL